MNTLLIGIDPGVSGAVGILKLAGTNSSLAVMDLPVTTRTYLTNQSKSLDIPAFASMIERHMNTDLHYIVLAIEQMQSMGLKTPPRTLTMLAEMAGHIEASVRIICRYKKVPLFIRKFKSKTWTNWMFPDSGGMGAGVSDSPEIPVFVNPERVGGVQRGFHSSMIGSNVYIEYPVTLFGGYFVTGGDGQQPCHLQRNPGQRALFPITCHHTIILVDGRELYVQESLETVLERLGVTEINPPTAATHDQSIKDSVNIHHHRTRAQTTSDQQQPTLAQTSTESPD